MTDIDRPELTGDPLTVTCNYCGAPIGTPCRVRGSGRPRSTVHNDRPAKAAAVAFTRSPLVADTAAAVARARERALNPAETRSTEPPMEGTLR